jgi:GNAT superfamily N-acetyltransferase
MVTPTSAVANIRGFEDAGHHTVQNAGEEVIIGFGEYVARGESAEIAFVVEEDWQGRGIASRLLQHLIRIAHQRGVVQFEAEVLKENGPMLAVFRHSGLPMATRNGDDVVLVTLVLNTTPSPETKRINPDEMSVVR